jgi:hypothetical protein
VIQLSYDVREPLRATNVVMGSMSTLLRRLPRSPVTHTFDPPSIIRLEQFETQQIVMEDRVSPCRPQTCGEHTTWVTLSVINWRWGKSICVESGPSSVQRSIATVVGEIGHRSASRRHPGGHSLVGVVGRDGGSSGGGNAIGVVAACSVESPGWGAPSPAKIVVRRPVVAGGFGGVIWSRSTHWPGPYLSHLSGLSSGTSSSSSSQPNNSNSSPHRGKRR